MNKHPFAPGAIERHRRPAARRSGWAACALAWGLALALYGLYALLRGVRP